MVFVGDGIQWAVVVKVFLAVLANVYWSVCDDGERKENGSFDDYRMDWPGCGGVDEDLDEASE